MLRTTVGQLAINEALPEDLRDYTRVLDKAGVKKLFTEVAEKHPDEYREIAKKISDVARDAAYTTGGHSFGLRHLRTSLAGRKMQLELGQELRNIYKRDIPDAEKDAAMIAAVDRVRPGLIEGVLKEAWDTDNPLARQLKGAGRGNVGTLNSLLGGDLLYEGNNQKTIPVPVLRNYSQGLRPHEYFAGAFGARKGTVDVKLATQNAGFLSKQLAQAAHRLIVTDQDDDQPYDEAHPRGLPADTSDEDNVGAYLAHPVAGYKRNTELTPRILKDLQEQGHDRILVRSPMVGGAPGGGVYAMDAGRREKGRLAPIGDYVGLAAAQALSEPISQSQLSSKHSGGVAGATAGAVSGFKAINAMIQVPKIMQGGAAHAQLDGRVNSVEPAPQGGNYVTIGSEQHYVGPQSELTVKPGDEVEAGDLISNGLPNPAEIVRHKGVGEGRRYFVSAFRKLLGESGVTANRRNVELLARGLINHVRLTDEVGDYAPDDVVPYQEIERQWKPRPGYAVLAPKAAIGKYLERPIMHYSVGTRIKPSMLPDLQKFGVKSVAVHNDAPPFQPEMVRGMANAAADPDWMTNLIGSYQSKSLLEAARRGAVSDTMGTSYVPPLASSSGFGQTGLTKGWNPHDKAGPGAA